MTSKKLIIIYFICFNFFLYVDRGILPGSSEYFVNFVKKTTSSKSPSALIGVLQSSFITGLSIASPIIAHYVQRMNAKRLLIIASFMWSLSLLISAVSYWSTSFPVLLIGRMATGIGEAAFMCIAPPILQDLGHERAGLIISVYFSMIPIGTAVGFVFGAIIASTPIGWGGAYLIIAVIGAILIIATTRIPEEVFSHMFIGNRSTTVVEEVKIFLTNPIFLFMSFAYAAFSAVVIANSTFGSSILIGLGYFNSQTKSSLCMGIIAGSAGLVGTLIGGAGVDSQIKRSQHTDLDTKSSTTVEAVGSLDNFVAEATASLKMADDSFIDSRREAETPSSLIESETDLQFENRFRQIQSILLFTIVVTLVGFIFLIWAPFLRRFSLLILTLTLGLIGLFSSQTGVNISLMLCVKDQLRSSSVAFGTLILHILGDVPSPVVIGWLKDKLAPHCTLNDETGLMPSQCSEEASGLRLTLLITNAWTIWMPFFFVLSYVFSTRSIKKPI